MAENISLASIQIDYLDAEWAPKEGGPGYYYTVEGTAHCCGPFETKEGAIEAVTKFLEKCAVDFIKKSLNLERS